MDLMSNPLSMFFARLSRVYHPMTTENLMHMRQESRSNEFKKLIHLVEVT